MSIAFLTLILGFLLGKSTTERHQLIREHNKRLLTTTVHRDSDIDNIENALITIVRAKLSTNFNEYYSDHHLMINSEMKQSFTNCIAATSFNTSQDDLEDFTRHLVREEFNSFMMCADNLIKFLQNIQ